MTLWPRVRVKTGGVWGGVNEIEGDRVSNFRNAVLPCIFMIFFLVFNLFDRYSIFYLILNTTEMRTQPVTPTLTLHDPKIYTPKFSLLQNTT